MAVLGAMDVSRESYQRARSALEPREPGQGDLTARPALQHLIEIVVRLQRPKVIVETGVARGASTAVILAVLHERKNGHLYSVDLPPLGLPEERVGELVEPSLRDRWTLLLGPSQDVLPELLQRIGPIDLFIHDSDHTYAGQLRELRLAWPHLRPGGVVVCDDIANPAFLDFAEGGGVQPFLIDTPGHPDVIGLVAKR